MSKQINITINGNKFDVDLDDEFASYMLHQMSSDFNLGGNTNIKTLLHAYVKASHKMFEQNRELEKVIQKLDI